MSVQLIIPDCVKHTCSIVAGQIQIGENAGNLWSRDYAKMHWFGVGSLPSQMTTDWNSPPRPNLVRKKGKHRRMVHAEGNRTHHWMTSLDFNDAILVPVDRGEPALSSGPTSDRSGSNPAKCDGNNCKNIGAWYIGAWKTAKNTAFDP